MRIQTNIHPITNSPLLQTMQLQKHALNPDFDVTKLLRYVGVSRTDLHRKLTRMVGMSATEYVRHIRLQHATKLLLEQLEWSINQTSFGVRFNSQRYFTRVFIKAYGIPNHLSEGTWR